MTAIGWAQIALVLAAVIAAAIPLSAYIARVLAGERTFLSPVLAPVERVFYKLSGVDPAREQSWFVYTIAMLAFSVVGFLSLYALQRLQNVLPLNPQGFDGVPADLAFNTSMSFITNTNWQNYGGETTMSHLVQMLGLTVHNFVSAATGLAMAFALVRGFARAESPTVGNFWVDLTRATLYVLLPISIVVALALVALGVRRRCRLGRGDDARRRQAGHFDRPGREPGGDQGARHQWRRLLQRQFGASVREPQRHLQHAGDLGAAGHSLRVGLRFRARRGRLPARTRHRHRHEHRARHWRRRRLLGGGGGNPLLTSIGVDPSPGNMEGKEVRFGPAMSALYATATTGTSTGAVNSMHDSFMPLGGLVPLFNMLLGCISPGGVGAGLYGFLVLAVIAVFVAGLMVGRTPEYLGKKIEAREMKLAMLAVLIYPLSVLGFSAASVLLKTALDSLNNAGPHGLSEILYAFASTNANNGSAFAGLTGNTPWYNTTLGLAMFLGRFAYVIPVLAMAGSFAAKKKAPASAGTFPTHGPLFVGLLLGVIVILYLLQYFPALALGPIVEHFLLLAGKTF